MFRDMASPNSSAGRNRKRRSSGLIPSLCFVLFCFVLFCFVLVVRDVEVEVEVEVEVRWRCDVI
jgi:hypothetical protein